jgi:hypothetical protein
MNSLGASKGGERSYQLAAPGFFGRLLKADGGCYGSSLAGEVSGPQAFSHYTVT